MQARPHDEDEQHRQNSEGGDLDLPGEIGEDIDEPDHRRRERQPHEEYAGNGQFGEKQESGDHPPGPAPEKREELLHQDLD